jgi:anti-sigma-K factor RskA
MSDAVLPPEDPPEGPESTLAAEYVLRLLGPDEEAACAVRVDREPAFAAEVARWQAHFSALDEAFSPVAPPVGLQARIEERLFGRRPSLLARIWGSAGLWRTVAAAALIALGVLLSRPTPPPEAPVPDLVATVAPTVGDVQLVALVDRPAGVIRFTRLAGSAPAGQSLELWVLPEGATAPASLGVIPSEDRFAVPIPAAYADQIGPGTAILVSAEAAGGSPTGQPQGQVLASGAVSEL